MIVNISEDVMDWVACCRDLWNGRFAHRLDGDDEFLEVETALFSALVLSTLSLYERPALDVTYRHMSASYVRPVVESRPVCRSQKAGNIVCSSRAVEFPIGATFPVRSIDCLGTMFDDRAYVELQLEKGEFLLEPIENLAIELDLPEELFLP